MAVSKFIQAVKDETRGRPRSTQWYRDKIKEFGKPELRICLEMVKGLIDPFTVS